MQDCRTDCGCSRKCLGYPRHALCLACARYCTTPHRNFDGPASQLVSQSCQSSQFAAPGRATGWTGATAGRACILLVWAAWVVGGPHQWFLGGSLAPFPLPPCAWFWFRSQFLGPPAGTVHLPRPDPDERVLSWLLLLKKTVGEADTLEEQRKEEGWRGNEGRRGDELVRGVRTMPWVPWVPWMLCCVVLVLCRCCQRGLTAT